MSTAVLEAPVETTLSAKAVWPAELVLVRAADRRGLLERLAVLDLWLAAQTNTSLLDLAHHLNTAPGQGATLAVVANDVADLRKKLSRGRERLADPSCRQIKDSAGLFFFEQPLGPQGKIAFLFPGEGAQYLGMLADLAALFPEVADDFARWDAAAARAGHPRGSLSSVFLLPPGASATERQRAEDELRQLGNAMLTVLMADWAVYQLLCRLGLRPDAVAGHSMGELAALNVAGAVRLDETAATALMDVVRRMEEQEAADGSEAVLLAVGAGRQALADLLEQAPPGEVFLAMDNCPHQSVLVGLAGPMTVIERALQSRRVMCERLPFRRPYHTPLFAAALEPLRPFFASLAFTAPQMPVYSCTTARRFPDDPDAIRGLTVDHWASPVEFTRLVEHLYDDGVRLFIEAGPRGNLSSFVEDALRGRAVAALPANVQRRPGPTQLLHLLAQLAAHHVPLQLEYLYQGRSPRPLAAPQSPSPSRSAVLNGYLEVMEQFLDTQREVMEAYFQRRPRLTVAPSPAPPRPLLGTVVTHEPGRSLALRRPLDLGEDHFATHHTVGGRTVSKVDPGQYGLPVMPMTFTLELMAEAAEALVPGRVVVGVRDVKLFRWLAFDEEKAGEIEVKATVAEKTTPGLTVVRVEVRDLGVSVKQRLAAEGTVEMAAQYPEAPMPTLLPLPNARACVISNEQLYQSLFHGPLLEGVIATDRINDDRVEGRIRVLPRQGLFASQPEPRFLLDPVLLDVAMHPICSWHLEQPDQSGRVILPFEMKRLEVFGPPLPEGTQLTAVGRIEEQSPRHFGHGFEVIGPDGRVWVRISGTKLWRFYVPFGRITFHGPKDEYFLSARGEDLETALRRALSDSVPLSIAAIVPPADLQRSALRLAAARVVFTPAEYLAYRQLGGSEQEQAAWLFERLIAKDAVRHWYTGQRGEKLFPADIETSPRGGGQWRLWRRAAEEEFPRVAVAHAAGWWVAMAAPCRRLGLGLVEAASFDSESAARLACARQALGMALETDDPSGELQTSEGDIVQLRAAGRLFSVPVLREKGYWVAVVLDTQEDV